MTRWQSRVSFRDLDGDGRPDFRVVYSGTLGWGDCAMDDEGSCEIDETREAHYSIERDVWTLAAGTRWPI